ncbi:protein gp37 [Roseomonas rosea]|uniref:Protein gp37 n=1 Tax=Muricoccus roseus TaxID=198092 RepID=A0A1M6LAJ2_9PROT|nr:phage Gp37/Gp68 family protein [Roseomonas rosea]SHJ68227.1 protein gp37 [Roseomonas rosea]
MAEVTGISWATSTFNPWIGCTPVSAGCNHCYAETLATSRLGVAWGPHALRRRTSPGNWKKPLAWNRKAAKDGQPWRVFCSSLADVFDNRAPEGAREDLWELIRATPSLTWMLLTKRPGNIPRMLPRDWADGWPHVWLGTSVENQAAADTRVRQLLDVPAALHFLSCEPLLGPLDLRHVSTGDDRWGWLDSLSGLLHVGSDRVETRRIGWVIAGGESGPRARAVEQPWLQELRDQCGALGVPFHFKQWGGRTPTAGGHLLDGAEHLEVPA